MYPKVTSRGQPATRGLADLLYSAGIRDAKIAFHNAVRQYDPDRIIFTGDSLARNSAWHNTIEGTWTQDTRAEWLSMISRGTRPAVYESASIHVYPHHDGQYFSGESVLLEELIGTVVSHAVSHGAVSFLGAFGPLTATDPTPAAQQQTWPRFFALIETTGVDIAAARA